MLAQSYGPILDKCNNALLRSNSRPERWVNVHEPLYQASPRHQRLLFSLIVVPFLPLSSAPHCPSTSKRPGLSGVILRRSSPVDSSRRNPSRQMPKRRLDSSLGLAVSIPTTRRRCCLAARGCCITSSPAGPSSGPE